MGTQVLLASGGGEYPRPIGERRLMPYVLSMTTGQIGNPVALLILMIPNDRLLHIVMMLVAREQTKLLLYRFSNGSSGR
jgi:hypothetical protein